MRTDFERAKERTLKEFETVVSYYNETIKENFGHEGSTENFAFLQQAFAIQKILKNAFGVTVEFERHL